LRGGGGSNSSFGDGRSSGFGLGSDEAVEGAVIHHNGDMALPITVHREAVLEEEQEEEHQLA